MKKKKSILKKRIWITILTISLVWTGIPSVSYAAPSTTKEQIEHKEKEKEALNKKKKQSAKELEELKQKQKKLQERLRALNEQMTQLSVKLIELDGQIREKEAEILATQESLEKARQMESWQYDCMTTRIQMSYERGNRGLFEALLTLEGFAQLLNSEPYQQGVAAYDDTQLDEIIRTREFIESEEVRLQEEQAELTTLQQETEQEKSKVNSLIKETGEDIAEYGDLIEDAEAEALEYERQLKQAESDLKTLKAKLAAELELSRRAASGTWRSIGNVTFTESDRTLLANLIYCEAGAESYEGKVAVGAVVVNRVLSGCFPDTMVGVVYQKGQFSPARSGRLELALAANKATTSCYQAADEAMAGKSNVGNCVHFRTPVKGLTGISIGGHIFY